MNIHCTTVDSPVGRLTIAAQRQRVVGLCFEGLWERRRRALEKRFGANCFEDHDDAAGASTKLRAYFGGNRHALDDIEIETWGTPFQQQVWQQLRRIPCGETRTYSQLARAVGAPSAVRAVGAANGANPIGLVLPCHRVIGSNGSLTGFAGGLANKRWLLDHEGAQLPVPALVG